MIRLTTATVIMFLCFLATWIWQFNLKDELKKANDRSAATQMQVDDSLLRVNRLEEELRNSISHYKSIADKLDAKTRLIFVERHTWMSDLVSWIREGIEDRFTYSMFTQWEADFFEGNRQLNRPPKIVHKKPKRNLPVVPKSGYDMPQPKMGLNIEQP